MSDPGAQGQGPYGGPPYGTPPQPGAPAGNPANGGPTAYGTPVPYDQPVYGSPQASYPGYQPYQAAAPLMGPYGPVPVDPYTGRPISPKSKMAAGLLQIFLGTLGVGRFYMGRPGIGAAQLVLTIIGWLTAFVGVGIVLIAGVGIWAFIDGIVILTGRPTDEHGREMR